MHGKLVAFAATTDAARARTFYTKVLGLAVRYEDDVALSLDSDGTELRLQKVDRFTPHPFTALGWEVANISASVEQLTTHGVTLERYPWLDQDAAGIWAAPSGALVGWFRDPDGNLLSVAQYASSFPGGSGQA